MNDRHARYERLRRGVAALVVCGCLALVCAIVRPSPRSSAAEAVRWDTPMTIGAELPSSWFPDIQADATGAVRLVWDANLADPRLLKSTEAGPAGVMLSQLGAGGWSKPADVQTGDWLYATRTVIWSDGTWVHLLFRRSQILTGVRLWYTRAPAGGDLTNAHAWSTPVAISNDEAYYSQIVGLPDHTLVIVYNQVISSTRGANQEDGTRTGLYMRRSLDQGRNWGEPVRLSNGEARAARTSLALSPDGKTLIAVWDEGYDNMTGKGQPVGVGLAVSRDGGATWGGEQVIRSTNGPIEQSAIAFGASGPVLIYRSTVQAQLFYRIGATDGGGWSEERPIPQVVPRPYSQPHHFDRYALAADGSGRLLLAYVGADAGAPNGLSVWVTSYADGAWGTPQMVAAPAGYPEYPRLAVALGNRLHLVFFVRDNPFDVGHYVVWWVAGQSDAPAVAPAAVGAVPQPVATPTLAAREALAAVPVVPTAPATLPPLADQLPQDVVVAPMERMAGVLGLALLGVGFAFAAGRAARALLG